MGSFSNNAITDVGKMLLADVQAGAVFKPTRIVMGSGTMPNGTTIQRMTNVITPVKSLAINKKSRTPDGKCVFGGVYTNEEITAPFYFRELALYAKAVYLNPDGTVKSEGAETLYSYGNAGATADYMPAYSTSTVVEKQMDLVIWVGEDAQVDLTIESGVHVSQKEFNSHASRHAIGGGDPITPASIGAAPAGYVHKVYDTNTSGTVDNAIETELVNMPYNSIRHICFSDKTGDSIFLGGVTNITINKATDEYVTVEAIKYHATGVLMWKRCKNVTWRAWEYVNPRFVVGEEYHTTERRNGKSVNKILDTDGVLKYRLDGETGWRTYAAEIGAAPAGYVHKIYDTNTIETVDDAIEAELENMPYNSIRHICFSDRIGDSIFLGGVTNITINKATDEYVTVEAIKYHLTGVLMWKRCKNVTWREWEWVNPPLNPGVEYRTTERYKGLAVYKKVDTAGNILWRAEGEQSWRVLASVSNIAPASV